MRKVYVLGAGASAGAGLPLMSNFLEKAEELQVKLNFKFENIWKYLDVHHHLKNSNIEEIMGYLDMRTTLYKSNPNNDNLKSDKQFRSEFLEFIDSVIILSGYYSDEITASKYSELLKTFEKNLNKDDTIISFNYDFLIDDCLIKNDWCIDYGIDLEGYKEKSNGKRIHLLKLHGSLNWSICPICKKPQWDDPTYLLERSRVKSSTSGNSDKLYDKLYENLVTSTIVYNNKRLKNPEEARMQRIRLGACHKNEKHTNQEVLIVPPSWNKSDYPDFHELWLKAHERLKEAGKIIFIGYSFPQTDSYFKYLLLSSLPKNIDVEVVDCKIQNIAGRYLEIFDNISFKAKKFEDYYK